MSSDGTKMAAVCGQTYLSTDSGVTWTPSTLYNAYSIAMSSDGTKNGSDLFKNHDEYTTLRKRDRSGNGRKERER